MAYKLCPSMAAADVTATLKLALQASGLNQVPLDQHPRLLSDNGPSYVASELADWLDEQGMRHTRGKPYHPMTQGRLSGGTCYSRASCSRTTICWAIWSALSRTSSSIFARGSGRGFSRRSRQHQA